MEFKAGNRNVQKTATVAAVSSAVLYGGGATPFNLE